MTVGRGQGDVGRRRRAIPPLRAGRGARSGCEELIALYDRGMREPLALACQTSAAFAQNGETAARRAWTSEWSFDKEDRELEHQLVFGGVLDFDELARASRASPRTPTRSGTSCSRRKPE